MIAYAPHPLCEDYNGRCNDDKSYLEGSGVRLMKVLEGNIMNTFTVDMSVVAIVNTRGGVSLERAITQMGAYLLRVSGGVLQRAVHCAVDYIGGNSSDRWHSARVTAWRRSTHRRTLHVR
jgi:hypothetical protein